MTAESDVPEEAAAAPSIAAERAELTALRRGNVKLRTEQEILEISAA